MRARLIGGEDYFERHLWILAHISQGVTERHSLLIDPIADWTSNQAGHGRVAFWVFVALFHFNSPQDIFSRFHCVVCDFGRTHDWKTGSRNVIKVRADENAMLYIEDELQVASNFQEGRK